MVAILRILKALDSKISSSLALAALIGGKLGVDGNTSNASICKLFFKALEIANSEVTGIMD
jgi:hypothetical protein